MRRATGMAETNTDTDAGRSELGFGHGSPAEVHRMTVLTADVRHVDLINLVLLWIHFGSTFDRCAAPVHAENSSADDQCLNESTHKSLKASLKAPAASLPRPTTYP